LNYENFGKTETSGVDIDITNRFNMGSYGTLNLGMMNMLALTYRSWDIDENRYRPNTVGLRGVPRWTSVLSASWKKGNLTSTLRVNRSSATALNYDETDEAIWNQAGCKARIKATDDLPCYRLASMRTDLNFLYTGFTNLRLTLNIRNALLDSGPSRPACRLCDPPAFDQGRRRVPVLRAFEPSATQVAVKKGVSSGALFLVLRWNDGSEGRSVISSARASKSPPRWPSPQSCVPIAPTANRRPSPRSSRRRGWPRLPCRR
jgi:hypothetical protein